MFKKKSVYNIFLINVKLEVLVSFLLSKTQILEFFKTKIELQKYNFYIPNEIFLNNACIICEICLLCTLKKMKRDISNIFYL